MIVRTTLFDCLLQLNTSCLIEHLCNYVWSTHNSFERHHLLEILYLFLLLLSLHIASFSPSALVALPNTATCPDQVMEAPTQASRDVRMGPLTLSMSSNERRKM